MHFVNRYPELPSDFYSEVFPESMPNAKLLQVNRALKEQMGCSLTDADLLRLLSGEAGLLDCMSVAQKYTGHQFGYYNPDLGDGRGVLLGQMCDENNVCWDIHLKGAGRTPYSRRGDGRAVLRSTIREYLASEALHGLGIPTTRALALAVSDEQVRRELLEPRATLLRVTQSHIRFGHFEWARTQGEDSFDALLNKVLDWHYPELKSTDSPVAELLKTICERTAKMIAAWQSVGFNHGVMNTDNMSILGETFDFGPYAFMDDFQIGYICNHSDDNGRYAYNEQPKIGLWNCQVLASTFQPLLTETELEAAINGYIDTYNQAYLKKMMLKLGCQTQQDGDKELVAELLILMDAQRVDFSVFFRRLSLWNGPEEAALFDLLSQPKQFAPWFEKYRRRLVFEDEVQVRQVILSANPSMVLRNYIAQEIIESVSQGDMAVLDFWLPKLQNPFESYSGLEEYEAPPSLVQKGIQLSCSS